MAKLSRYNESELRALKDGLASGKSVATIAREMGRDPCGLYARSLSEGWRRCKSEMFNPEARALAVELYADHSNREIAKRTGLKVAQIKNLAIREGLRKSAEYMERTKPLSYFHVGHATWNKGKKHAPDGSRAAQFKPGELNGRVRRLFQPIGTERVRDGILTRKVSTSGTQQRDWVAVHRLVWEEAHGEVPKGMLVVFKLGMKTTHLESITVDRLECVTRAENMQRNSHYTRYPPEVASLIQLRGALNRKIRNKTKGDKHADQ